MKHLRLCIIGNILGRNPGHITTQGQILGDLLLKEGYAVVMASSKLNRALRLLDIVRTMVRYRNETDILVTEVYSGKNFFVAYVVSHLSRILRVPAVFVLHGGNLPDLARRHPRYTGRVFARVDRLIAPSKYLARRLQDPGLQISVIPNVVDLSGYPFNLRRSVKPNLFWMRAFHENYNPRMAVKALSSIRAKYPKATLVMAGVDKGLEPEVKNMAEDMGLSDAIRFPGFLDQESKIRELSKADIFLNTNRTDNMPVSVLEACAMGLPVVATCVGGIPDLIRNGHNGLLVPDSDVEGMVSAVESLLENRELAVRLSFNGRKLAERSSWENVRIQWEELFRDLHVGRNDRELEGLSVGNATN